MHTLTRRHDDYPEIPGYTRSRLTFPVLLVGLVDLVIWAVVIGTLLGG